ncbi:MAG: hypothetical protein IPL61_29455 [Myxococcales bacterium]|nr:hypothetical protein [Myxococcales bacterium]
MLYQLCTGELSPPNDPYRIYANLQRRDVDVDLIAIVRKACAPDAGDRYKNAGRLASDLRAFVAGARILARTYSAAALVSHWVKRHKRLAVAIVSLTLAFAAVAVIAFVRVQSERDRAEGALTASREAGVREEAARKTAETERDSARAAQVRELLVRDPTQALPIAEQLPKTPENAVLLARVKAHPIATHSATAAPSAFQDAVLHSWR